MKLQVPEEQKQIIEESEPETKTNDTAFDEELIKSG